MNILLIVGYACIPLAFVSHFLIGKDASWEPVATFALAGLGVLPLAHMMGQATERLAERTGPTWGGLLNASFGNAAELIIAFVALSKGLNEVVKASLTGSILGNLLLVGGGAMVVGGWRREKQTFSHGAAEANGGLLALAVAAMLIPAIFHLTGERMHDQALLFHEHEVSVGTSIVLLAIYGLGLLFTLRTHRHLFSRERAGQSEKQKPARSGQRRKGHSESGNIHEAGVAEVSIKSSIVILLIASAGVAIVAELLVGSAEAMAARLGWNHLFVGIILLAIVGNAAEHSTAMLLAHRDDMDTAMTITYQSSLQIALFAVPMLVLVSSAMHGLGWSPAHAGRMNLIFTPMEVASVLLAVALVVTLGRNGETNWFEGALLLALYVIIAVAFFYVPTSVSPEAHA